MTKKKYQESEKEEHKYPEFQCSQRRPENNHQSTKNCSEPRKWCERTYSAYVEGRHEESFFLSLVDTVLD